MTACIITLLMYASMHDFGIEITDPIELIYYVTLSSSNQRPNSYA